MTTKSGNSVLSELDEGMRVARSTGVVLDPWVRHVLEDRFGTSLAAVRVHTGPEAARLAQLLRADALTRGTDVFFAADRYRPQSTEGMRVLAHEISHVLQQAGSGELAGTDPLTKSTQTGRMGDRWEQAADRAAGQVMRGISVESPALLGDPPAIQCHDSFEHRALGDIPTDNLAVIAGGGAQRDEIIGREIDLMWLWYLHPEDVTADQINKQCPWIRTLRLATSGLLVTYGELNALPDYIATPDTADNIPKQVLLPILQFIRQQSYIELNKLLGKTVTDSFASALYTPKNWLPGMANTLLETALADDLTYMLGADCTDHYQGLLARNACHFAPFSWYRWQTPYLAARSLATNAHFAQDPGMKAQLTHEAWVQHGYGDHFLQDSFAAGHLVNKTLIMQWFIEWAASEKLLWVFDWEAILGMTTALQPGIAGRALYSPTFAGGSNDPQTAEEQATYRDRLVRTGVVVGASGDLDTAYQDYLALMSSLITQSSSAAIHDYYNSHSLWVASPAHPTPYEVWGDDTLLSGASGGTGAQMTSAAAQQSQQSIRELLADGATSLTAQQIKDQFPTQVRVSPSNMLLDLEAWNDAQQAFCNTEIFPKLHDFFIRMSIPTIPNVSQDQDLTARWNRLLPTIQQSPAPVAVQFATTTMLEFGGRILAGSNGYVYELHPATGAVLHSTKVSTSDGSVGYETRIATDGTMLYAGVHSGIAAVNLADWSQVAWSVSLSNVGTVVDVLTANGRLFAGSNGYVYEIDLSAHAIAHTLLLGSRFGQGDYTMRLAINQSTLIAGTHGWVYGVDINNFASAAWSCQLETLAQHPVEVLVHNGAVFAGSNGWVYEVSGGQIAHQLLVTSRLGVPGGDYTTTLAATDQMVFAGVHGYVYGIKRSDWSDSAWSANLAGNRYTMANLAATADQLVAGSYGYVYRVDPSDGNVRRTTLLTMSIGVGGSYETRVIFDPTGTCLYAGVHGYAYRISSELHSGSSLTPPQPMPGPMYNFWVVTGMVSTGVGYDITYGSINNYSVPAGYNDHCNVIVRGADGQEKARAAAPGTGATVRVTTTPAAGDLVDYYFAAPDGTNWAVAQLTAAGAAFEFWKIRNVDRLADGYSVTYGADGYGIPAGYNDHCYISVRGPDGREKGRTLAPGLDGTVKVAVTPQSGDIVLYYLAANDGTNWGVAGFTC